MSEENKVTELAPKKPETLRSKLFGGLGLALMGLGLAWGYQNYREWKLKQPYLLKHCFVYQGKTRLDVMAVVNAQTPEGKAVKAYGIIARVDFFAFPQAVEIEETNKSVERDLKAGSLVELNCETGAPLAK